MVFAKGFDQVNTAELDIPFSEYLDKIGAPPAIADLLRAQSYTLTGALPEEFRPWCTCARSRVSTTTPPIPSSPPWRASTSAAAAGAAGRRRDQRPHPSGRAGHRGDRQRRPGRRRHRRRPDLLGPQGWCWPPLNTLGDITFTPAVPAPLARLVRQGHTGRCIKVWSKLAGLEYVFAMGWPGIVECTVIGEVSERDGKRSIMASFGLAPDLAVDRVDLVQAGLDRLELGATVEEVYGHDWIGDPFSKGTWLALRPGQAPDLAAVESNWGAIYLAGADFAGVWSGGWTGPSSPAGDGGRRGCGPDRHASLEAEHCPGRGNRCLPTELTAQPAAQGVGRLRLAVDDEHLPRCRREPGGPADEFVGVGDARRASAGWPPAR